MLLVLQRCGKESGIRFLYREHEFAFPSHKTRTTTAFSGFEQIKIREVIFVLSYTASECLGLFAWKVAAVRCYWHRNCCLWYAANGEDNIRSRCIGLFVCLSSYLCLFGGERKRHSFNSAELRAHTATTCISIHAYYSPHAQKSESMYRPRTYAQLFGDLVILCAWPNLGQAKVSCALYFHCDQHGGPSSRCATRWHCTFRVSPIGIL